MRIRTGGREAAWGQCGRVQVAGLDASMRRIGSALETVENRPKVLNMAQTQKIVFKRVLRFFGWENRDFQELGSMSKMG